MLGFIFGVFALVNFGSGGTFQSLEVFGLIAMFSGFASYIAMKSNVSPFKWFDGLLNRKDLKWLGFGIAGIFASVIGITSVIPGGIGILIALFVGGIVLAIVLLKSQNFLAPILVHGVYNTIVLIASTGAFGPGAVIPLSASPIQVPVFNFEGLTPDNLLGQAAMQVFVVAGSEELLKIGIAIAMSLITRNIFVIMGTSVGAWTGMHAIISYVP